MSQSQDGRARARQLINQIVKDSGFVRESSLQTMSQDVRREVEEALLAKDKKIGHSILTLAKNLYTSDARFVFELLQNADDNQYHKTLAIGQAPFVSFKAYLDRIVVDCNEDGFTERNLRAICDIGNSSKVGSQGYIGEKGIGFKSVFMAAWKVHIQSGHFSFCFVHRKGDSGMGMVQPVWEEPKEELPHPLTRITLFLHEYQDAADLIRKRNAIRKQFRDLQATLLLFLRNIKRIDIFFYDEQEQEEWTRVYSMQDTQVANRVALERSFTDGPTSDDTVPERQIYHVTKYTATNLSRNENRDLLPAEEASKSYAKSEIVLAFPLTDQSVPIIEPQKVFAFLPMRQMGFNFLIQADFVTQANREDVVTTSNRNWDLIEGIANAVIKAVLQFCEHDTLQYSWMRYLPQRGTYHWDPFWAHLVDGIKQRLQEETVLRSQKGVLRRISSLKYRLPIHNDQFGNPLLRDLDPELYLSDSYTHTDIGILEKFGLSPLSMNDILDIVKQDLRRRRSRLKDSSIDDDWHSRAASMLSLPFKEKWSNQMKQVKALDLIPLNDGSWVRAADGEIFHDSVGNVPIPEDLGLRLLHPEPTKNAERRKLFSHLGVRSANVQVIRSLVFGRYCRRNCVDIYLDTSSEHLKFLYLTHSSKHTNESIDNNPLLIYNTLGNMVKLGSSDLYIQNDEPYGAQSLLGSIGALKVGVSFISPKYFEDAPETPSSMDLAWTDWMYEYLGVRRYVRLFDRGANSLSGESQYIAEHNPRKFLGFLRHLWPVEGELVIAEITALRKLKRMKVLCVSGKYERLSESYLPLPELQNVCRRFAEGEHFPFIQLPASAGDIDILSQWSFLTKYLGVGFKDDLEFRLRLVRYIRESAEDPLTLQMAMRLAGLYLYIEASCMESQNSQLLRTETYEFFKIEDFIWTPSDSGSLDKSIWVSPCQCLWDAPDDMISMKPLGALYRTAFANTEVDIDRLSIFFQKTLGIPNISYTHIIEELRAIKEQPTTRLDTVHKLYHILHQSHQGDSAIADEIRHSFEEYALVYVEQHGSSSWHQPSKCIWSSITNIEGKIAINVQYEDLKHFFTEMLGVRPVNLMMVHDSLLEVSSTNPSVERIKDLLRAFNSLLASDDNTPNPGRMLQRRVFPVRATNGGRVTLCSSKAEFFIVDRQEPFNIFSDRVEFLDFSLKEVCRLRHFIAWAGLESRYISRCVKEVSRVEGGIEMPITERNRDLKTKAYALLRIAAKFNSPRFGVDAQGLYDLLRSAVTAETEGISSRLELEQNNTTHEHEIEKSELHLEERDNLLKIYVPRNEDQQDLCFRYTLPRRLISWLLTQPGANTTNKIEEAAINVVNSVLNCRVSALSAILTKEGVPEIDVPDLSEECTAWAEQPHDPGRSEGLTAALPATPNRRNHSSEFLPRTHFSDRSTPETFSSSDETSFYPTPLTDLDDYFDEEPSARTRVDSRPPAIGLETRQLQYPSFLEKVVNLASGMDFPEFGSSDMSAAFGGLSIRDDVFTGSAMVHFSSEGERRVKIGAAGELLVFELLSNLDPSLPGFNLDNWPSRIRHHVSAHEKYADLPRFTETETSDIVYDDVSGMLTTLLIQKGYLSNTHWTGKTPKYYIEVKSTTDQCTTPFFVSDDQYSRMQETTNGPSGNSRQHEIYTIFRVFNLGKESTGIRIYIDPEEQRRVGKLKFTTDKYAVVPRSDNSVTLAGQRSH